MSQNSFESFVRDTLTVILEKQDHYSKVLDEHTIEFKLARQERRVLQLQVQNLQVSMDRLEDKKEARVSTDQLEDRVDDLESDMAVVNQRLKLV